MNKFVKVCGGVVVLSLGVVVAAPFLIPTDTIIETVSNQVESVTGRQLTISGETKLSVLPSLNIELNQVNLSNMPSGSRDAMMTMDQLVVHIPWLSLLGGEAKLEQFVVRNPNIILETDKQGKANWQLVQNSSPDSGAMQAVENKSAPTTLPSGLDIALGEVAIYGGQITYLDGLTGNTQRIEDLELKVALTSLYQPMEIFGAVSYQGERFELNTQIDTPAKAIEGQPFSLTKTLGSTLFDLTFNGQIKGQGQDIQGKIEFKGESLKAIAAWQQAELVAKEEAFNQFSIEGDIHVTENKVKLDNFAANLDALTIQGQSTINLGDRLDVRADVDLGMLDLNPYLPEQTHQPQAVSDTEKAEPIVWDSTEIDLSAISALDAMVTIKSSGIKAREIKLNESELSVTLKKGIATIGLDKFAAYEGTGKGKVTIDARKRPYAINTKFKLSQIDAGPLLTDAISFDKLTGLGSIEWQLNTKGQSQQSFISALAGDLTFEFKNGGVRGANIAEMLRTGQEMLKGDFSGLKDGLNAEFDPNKTTDFSSLSGSMVFNQGVGVNSDLALASPLLRITGKGKVDLPNTHVDYRLVTGIVASLEGQNSSNKSTGFKIPARIKGPFHAVETSLDISSGAKEQVKDKAKEKLKEKLGDKLKGLFG